MANGIAFFLLGLGMCVSAITACYIFDPPLFARTFFWLVAGVYLGAALAALADAWRTRVGA